MAGFLYFLPGLKGATFEDLERVGLGPVLEKAKFSFRETFTGPAGKTGVVIAVEPFDSAQGKPARCGYYPDAQEWIPGPGNFTAETAEIAEKSAKYWIGIEKANAYSAEVTGSATKAGRPGPGDVQREETVAGHFVTLGDGNEWLIPVAKSIVQETPLPKKLRIGPDGKWVKEALPRFYEICALAEKVWEDFGNGKEIAYEEGADIASKTLGVNYRIGPFEASVLGLLDTEKITRILQALIDIPTILAVARAREEAIKKKENPSTSLGINSGAQGSNGSEGGEAGLNQDTSPVSQTSPG